MPSTMLSVYVRHQRACPHGRKGRHYTGCRCPIWVQGRLHGRAIRQSLDTRDMQTAHRKIAEMENPGALTLKVVTVADAIAAFQRAGKDLAPSTRRKYGNVLRHLQAHCERLRADTLPAVTVEVLDSYREARQIGTMTWAKELETLRQFFGWCARRHWCAENPAAALKVPRNVRPRDEARPYTADEAQRILLAAGQIGRSEYERRRATAMVQLLRHTALRVSDVATLRRDRILPDGRILLRTLKTGGQVYLPLPGEVIEALASLPLPRNAEPWCPYYFWNGITSQRAVVGIAERALAAVFRKSGVANGKAHRWRHTLSTDVLARGGSMQDVADVLGISVRVAEKHYAKWNLARQDRIDRVMGKVWEGLAARRVM
jgi:integrase